MLLVPEMRENLLKSVWGKALSRLLEEEFQEGVECVAADDEVIRQFL